MLKIREAKKADSSKIVSFQLSMAKETENLDLDKEILEKGIAEVFMKPELGTYYVATWNEEVIGTLMITYEWSDWRNGMVWWIQSVYILSEHRSSGVFRKMYEYIQHIVSEKENVMGIRLYVDRTNIIAQKAYNKGARQI